MHLILSASTQLLAFRGICSTSYRSCTAIARPQSRPRTRRPSSRQWKKAEVTVVQQGVCCHQPPMPCSCSPLLLLCSRTEMRLLFSAPLSLLTSDHLFWDMLSGACRIGLCAIPCLEVALLGPSALLQSAFDALSCVCLPRDEEQRLVRPAAAVSLFHLLNSVHRASVLGIAWRLIAAGGFGPVLDSLALRTWLVRRAHARGSCQRSCVRCCMG